MTGASLTAAALAIGASLAWTASYAQPQSQPPTPPAAAAPDAPAGPSSGTAPQTAPQPLLSGRSANAPTYTPKPPSDNTGVYLPAVVGEYLKSSASCVVLGCDDGPAVKGTTGQPASGASTAPPPGPPATSGAAGAFKK